MPASVGWDNDTKTIIRQQLIGDWTFEDYRSSAKDTQTLTASMPHTVHVIIDFTQSVSYPTHMLSLGRSLDQNFPRNQGLLCIVKCPEYLHTIFAVMTKLYPAIGQNSHYVNTLDEAYAIIRAHESASDNL